MIQYRFKIGNRSNIAWLENDEQAENFSKFIGAEWERDTAIFRLKKDNKFCTFELEIGGIKNAELLNGLEFKNINIWEV
jgi:hypothetical protein